MEVQGTILKIGQTQTFGSNGFRKRELVLTTQEQYPQPLLIEFVQDKTEELEKFAEGQSVVIGINLRGREWTNQQGEAKYFNSIQGWRIKESEAVNDIPVTAEPVNAEPVSPKEDDDDLPF